MDKQVPDLENRPSLAQLEAELSREQYRGRYSKVLRSTIYALIVVAAVAVLVATLWMPVLQIYGSSMTPALEDGQIVLSVKDPSPEAGDIVAFYYNNKVLVKRVIGTAGDWITIEKDGDVIVNGQVLEEPYLEEIAYGDVSIELPHQVQENTLFVLGDHRSVSVDSRNQAVGDVDKEQVVGKIVFCIWPLRTFGPIN